MLTKGKDINQTHMNHMFGTEAISLYGYSVSVDTASNELVLNVMKQD